MTTGLAPQALGKAARGDVEVSPERIPQARGIGKAGVRRNSLDREARILFQQAARLQDPLVHDKPADAFPLVR